MKLLDQYVIKKFAMPFFYCFSGFIAIWFIFDLADNLQDFMQGKASWDLIVEYYTSQIPEIIVMSLPIATLLALLYSLTAMSRSNEIISMLGAGLSVFRVITPLLIIGCLLAGVSAYFNYADAPHAAAIRKQLLNEIKRGYVRQENLRGHLFRNREALRTWFIGSFRLETKDKPQAMENLIIVQQDKNQVIRERWYAESADFDPATKTWILKNSYHVVLNEQGYEMSSISSDKMKIENWTETPWRLSSSVMNPDYLSVPELRMYLEKNSDFPQTRLAAYRTHLHYRWALSSFSIVVILLAAPMGIVYSRRGILGGVAIAVALFFGLVFASNLSLAFGKGGWIPPILAAWLPTVIFFGIGSWLLWFRSTGRDFPKMKLPWA